jgi:hypothetical protein
METFLTAIANFGFPIVVAVFLLVKVDKTLGTLTKEVQSLREALQKHNDLLEDRRNRE